MVCCFFWGASSSSPSPDVEKMVLSHAIQHNSIPCYDGICDDPTEIPIPTQGYL